MAFRLPGLHLIASSGRRGVTSIQRGRRGQDECLVEFVEEPCDETLARRLRRVALARARAADPGLPRVLAFGIHEQRPYVVTADAPGDALRASMERGRLDLRAVARRLVSALVELHARGIVHGSLTAEDVVIDTSGLPRLVGAGLGPILTNDFHALGAVLERAGASRDARIRPVIDRLLAESGRRSAIAALIRDLSAIDPSFATGFGVERALVRTAELERLRRAWEDTCSGHGQIVVLEGARGAGKTTLARTLLSEIAPSATVLSAGAAPEDTRRFAAIERLFESHAPLSSDAIDQLRGAASELDPQLPDTIQALAALRVETRRTPPREITHRTAESLAELLIRWSGFRPVVLFVDDVEALDAPSARVLERVVARAAEGRLLVLMSGSDPTLMRWAAPRSVTELEVPRLARHEVAALVRLELEPSAVLPEVENAVIALSDATPLGTLEVTRTLLETQVVDLDWGTWRLDRARAPSAPEPTSVLIQRRAAGLGATAARVLASAAPAHHIDVDRLKTLAGVDDDVLDVALNDAAAAGLCSIEGTDVVVHEGLRAMEPATTSAGSTALPGMLLLEDGRVEAGLRRLEASARTDRDDVSRARYWLDVSWAREALLEPDAAEHALTQAFTALSIKPPLPRGGSLLGTATAQLGALRATRRGTHTDARRWVAAEVHSRAARVAMDRGQSMLAAENALRALDHATRTGHAFVEVEARMLLARLCAGTGFGRAGDRLIDLSRALALEIGDAALEVAFRRWDAEAALASGNAVRAVESDRYALERAHAGQEPLDLLTTLLHYQHIEALRGNPGAAWGEIERAFGRVRSNRSVSRVPDVLADVVGAVLTSLGRESDVADALAGLEDRLTPTPPSSRLAAYAWGARARSSSERGAIDEHFEALAARFVRAFPEPKQVPLVAVEHYVHVLHARIHAALRADPGKRSRSVEALTRAVADLEVAARIPLHTAHLRVGQAHLAAFSGNPRAARKAFAEAETLGAGSDAAWIIYSVARGRAHLLLAGGRADAARDHAAMAEIVARSSGSAYRLRWIREELGLAASSRRHKADLGSFAGGSSSTERLRLARPLDALRRASEDQDATPAADELLRSIVGELSDAFAARSAAAYRKQSGGLVRVECASVDVRPERPAVNEPPAALLHEAVSSRAVVISDDADALCSRAVLPVAFDETSWGVICLERPGCGAFSDEDRYALSALAAQATLTLQLSRRRRDAGPADSRARAVEELRAVTDFADSVARDLDGVFGAIHESVESAFLPVPEQQLSVLSTTEKARAFVQRLEAFARHRTEEPRVTDLNEIVLSLDQVLRPLVRAPAELIVNLDPELHPALVDPWVLEQLLVSLTINARRAIHGRGVLVLQSTNTELDDRATEDRASYGPYAMISLAGEYDAPRDSEGESVEAVDSWLIAGYGTRIHAAGGYVSTHREHGLGQTCRICLPARPKSQAGSGVVVRRAERASVVLVTRTDEAAVETLAHAFQQDNFEVGIAHTALLVGTGAPEAVVAEIDPSVPDLAQTLGDRFGAERVLFVSDHPKGLLLHAGLLPSGARFLQRPAADAFVVARVRRLLADSSSPATSAPVSPR